MPDIRDQAAIAGIGQTRFAKLLEQLDTSSSAGERNMFPPVQDLYPYDELRGVLTPERPM